MGFNVQDQDGVRSISPLPPSAEETALLRAELDLTNARLTAINSQSTLQANLLKNLGYDATTGTFTENATLGMTPDQITRANTLVDQSAGITDRLTGAQGTAISSLEDMITRGNKIDPQTASYIDELYANELGSGMSDIDRNFRSDLDVLREELAPGLGLRSSDTPILDRGGEIAEETTRQRGQLLRDIRGAAAGAKLNFPLQQGQLTTGQTGQVMNTAEAAKQFQNTLNQQAFMNRQLLLDTTGQFGLGLAGATGASPGAVGANLQGSRYGASPETVNFSNTGFNAGEAASSIGQLADIDWGKVFSFLT